MKKCFFLAFSLIAFVSGLNDDTITGDGANCDDPDPDKCGAQRRRLQTETHGPCTGFKNYGKANNPTCPKTPNVNPDLKLPNGLSIFARDWIDYTCCNIVSQDMSNIIPSVWLWLQVCTNAMNFATEEAYESDVWYGQTNVTSYAGGPLRNMRRYCPTDLGGGKLTEWVVTTFFPVMEEYNPNFKHFDHSVDKCKINPSKKTAGAATLLLATPTNNGTFGHLSMLVHEDSTKTPFDLPKDDDKQNYISFTNLRNTVGVMITGTKARHVGFGRDLENVTETLTVYNVDTEAMMREWKHTKESNQMFDLMNRNCARTVLEVLQAGYPDCKMHLDQLWTPERAFEYIGQVKERVSAANKVSADSPSYQLSPKTIQARQIYPEVRTYTNTIEEPIPWALILGIGLGTFFINLALAVSILLIVISRMKAEAEKKVEEGLANMLIETRGRSGSSLRAEARESSASKLPGIELTEPVIPSSLALSNLPPSALPPQLPPDDQVDLLPLESPRFSDTIIEQMDQHGNNDGQVDFEEFSAWAKNHKLEDKQIKVMWKELDKNNDGHVSKDEWAAFIQKRPRLKWLVSRLRSLHYR